MRSSRANERVPGSLLILLPHISSVEAVTPPPPVETPKVQPSEIPANADAASESVATPAPVPTPKPAVAAPKSKQDIQELCMPYSPTGIPLMQMLGPRGEVMGQVDQALRTSADAELSQPTMAVLQNPKGSMLALAALKRANVEMLWNRSQRDGVELAIKHLNARLQGVLKSTTPAEFIAHLILNLYE